MTKKITIVLIAAMFLSFHLIAQDTKLGGEMKLDKSINISEVLAKPDNFLGKKIRVEGYIVDGCKHHGTWIALASDKEFQKMDVWAKKGHLKFPLEHKGKYGIVEGTLYVIQMSEEDAINWLKHLGEKHDQEVDLEKAKGGMKLYRLDPSSAILKNSK